MGYFLEAFICLQDDAQVFSENYHSAVLVNLRQGLTLIPLTEELLNEIGVTSSDNDIEVFELLTTDLERQILYVIGNRLVAYIEAAYHGGEGGQMGIIWEKNRRVEVLSYGQGRINEVLKYFGVIANTGVDEFLTLGLDRYRRTQQWASNYM